MTGDPGPGRARSMPRTPTMPAGRRPWTRIIRIARPIFASDSRWKAIGWLLALLALVLSVVGLNVVNSYVGGQFMTAISERNSEQYREMAIRYLIVFAASTAAAVFAKFCEERLGIFWRGWLTNHLVDKYLTNRAYFRLMGRADIDNPDQRMTEDVKVFTTMTLSFLLMLLNASITAIAFARVLWLITPLLLGVAIAYSAAGSLLTIFVGRRLVGLNNAQLKKEANFRYELIHVREYADSIAILRGEKKQRRRLRSRLNELVTNFRKIVAVNRNLGFFTIGYNYLIQIIPILIVAPRYIRGEVELGVVTQSAMAFAQILGAFSLIVTQFTQISSFAAVVNRLGAIWEALEEEPAPSSSGIEIVTDESRVAYEGLTLRTPKDKVILIQDLNIQVPLGRRLLILGPDGIGKSALGRASVGIWQTGEGRIVRPGQDRFLFLPQRPYTALGTLRDQFFDAEYLGPFHDEKLLAALVEVSFGPILDRVGGRGDAAPRGPAHTLAAHHHLGIARLLIVQPPFAFLDRATSALSISRVKHVYQVLSRTSITYISVGDQPILRDYHDNVLELLEDGRWATGPTREPAAA